MKTVFVNPERCIGCRQCEFECVVAHSQSRDPVAALAEEPAPRRRIHVEMGATLNASFPNHCRHCDPAPCQQVCPTGAIYRDPDEDLVLLDAAKCIACAMCAIVCPFAALTFHAVAGNGNGVVHPLAAVKCDGCIDRVRRGEEPACVEACKTDALVYGEVNDLVATGRVGAAAKALRAAASVASDIETDPDNVAAWRSFGTELKAIESRES